MNTSSTTKPGDAQAASVIRPAARIADAIRKAAAAQNVAVEAVLEELGAIHATAPKAAKKPMLYIQAHPKTLTFPDPEAYDTETTGDDFYFVHKLAQTIPYGTVYVDASDSLVRVIPAAAGTQAHLASYKPSNYRALAAEYIYAFRPIPLKRVKGEPVVDEDGNPVPVRPYVNVLEKKYGERLDLTSKWLEEELNQPEFVSNMPKIRQLVQYPCCLPVWRNGKHGDLLNVRHIAKGYDREGELLVTADEVPTVPPMTLEQARTFIWEHIEDFPFDGVLGDPTQPSAGAAVAVMVGALCHACFDHWPIVIASADQQNAGKSLLIKTLFLPFFGYFEPASQSGNPDSDVYGHAKKGCPIMWLDEKSNVYENVIKAVTTSTGITYRPPHSAEQFTAPWRSQIAVSANSISANADVKRRSIRIDIQFAGKRDFKKDLELLKNDETWRAQMREAVYTIVREFIDSGAFEDATQYVLHDKGTTFRPYLNFCARCAMFAGFGDATAPRVLDTFSDDSSDTVKDVLDAIASHIVCAPTGVIKVQDSLNACHSDFEKDRRTGAEWRITVQTIKDILLRNDLLESVVSDVKDAARGLGRKLAKWTGARPGAYRPEVIETPRGIKYKVGKLNSHGARGVLITVLEAPTSSTPKA